MDTVHDWMVEGREELLGATDDKFRDWLCRSFPSSAEMFELAFEAENQSLIDALKERFWDPFLEELEEANRSARETRSYFEIQ